MIRLALATCAALPNLDPDDQLLLTALRTLEPSWVIDTPIWNDPAVDWSDYDMVVIRSTWDYMSEREAYVAWANRVARQTTLWNPAELVAWNTTKRYLAELEEKGVSVVPTLWLPAGDAPDLKALIQARHWAKFILKPVVSASSKNTFLLSASDMEARQAEWQASLKNADFMVQPYFRSVETDGEWSFLFFNGHFSHAVQKVPKAGEFRVQAEFGGQYRLFKPTEKQRAFAEKN